MKKLWTHQREALSKIRNGSVLVGSTGSGKSLVGLTYYYERVLGGSLEQFPPKPPTRSVDLYVITTAMKRDSRDWEGEAGHVLVSTDRQLSASGVKLVVDSWNNISKYTKVNDQFFIFDEQKTTGYGVWSKSFIKISSRNQWILLTATPGDRWIDLMPVFIANGFYRNKTDFIRRHVIYSPYTKYPRIRKYVETDTLKMLRDKIFVVMPYKLEREVYESTVLVSHDAERAKRQILSEWNWIHDRPVRNFQEQVYLIRRIINSDPSRIEKTLAIQKVAKKLIVFYNFNYELESLISAFSGVCDVAQHNGHSHDQIPETDSWVYLVQYMSGNEAWECFETNHMLFFSQNYSYRILRQAMGRINRLTTTYEELYYYHLVSTHKLDVAISKALESKKDFNENDLEILFHSRD